MRVAIPLFNWHILTQCTRQVMLLHMHKCSSLIPRPLQVDIWLETRVSQKVGSQANTTTTMCVGHSSFMTLILCAGVIITVVTGSSSALSCTVCAWHKLRRSLAMRLGGMIPVYSVYCTQFELWFESRGSTSCMCLSPLLHIVSLVCRMLSWQL